jgi:3-dehydroshikimate dehydratase
MITISLCSLVYREQPITDLIPKIAACGYDAVEIFGGQLEGKSDAELAAIRDLAAKHNLKILGMSPYLSFTRGQKEYDESIEKVKKFMHYGDVLNCRRLRTFTDVGPTGIGSAAATPEQWAQGIRGLKEITKMAPDMEFMMETHPLTLADTIESTQRVLRDVGATNLKLIYQPTTNAFLERGIIESWRILKPDVTHMHLQNIGGAGNHGWMEEGQLDLANYLFTVKADGYDGSISIEYHWKDTPWERIKSAYDFTARALGRPTKG